MPVSSEDSSPLDDLRVLLFLPEELPVASDDDSSDPLWLASLPLAREEVVDSPDLERVPDFGDAVVLASDDSRGEACEFAGGVRLGFGVPVAFGETEAVGAADALLPADAAGEAEVAP